MKRDWLSPRVEWSPRSQTKEWWSGWSPRQDCPHPSPSLPCRNWSTQHHWRERAGRRGVTGRRIQWARPAEQGRTCIGRSSLWRLHRWLRGPCWRSRRPCGAAWCSLGTPRGETRCKRRATACICRAYMYRQATSEEAGGAKKFPFRCTT